MRYTVLFSGGTAPVFAARHSSYRVIPSTMNSLPPCELCPRRCRADRGAGAIGYCRAGAKARVYRWGPHSGEEPPISGTRGSGTVFFSHCTLSCLYCQNHPWSQGDRGETYDTAGLAGILRELADAGCHNWNLVTPTPWLPQIRAAADTVRDGGASLPFVYNTSGFERIETVSEYRDLLDIVLTDLRYACADTASEASGARAYVECARSFLKWSCENVGPLECDGEGIATGGTICRILVLPGHADEAVANLEWMADNVGTDVAVSLMAQYTPVHRAAATSGWNRRITREEYDRVVERLDDLGFENGWVQELDDADPGAFLGEDMAAGRGTPPPSNTPPL